MATLTVRNFDDAIKAELRVQAAERGRSMEEDVRQLLREAVERRRRAERKPYRNLAEAIAARFDPLGGVELELPSRTPLRDPPDSDDAGR
ncbi:FitA-like ribbon-helix-helix domain-containing protein [Methylopila turkensis]|nr:plasmid stabilization protein [Methylopila turkensis]